MNKKEREEVGSLTSKADVQELVFAKLQLFTKLTVTRNGRSEEARAEGQLQPQGRAAVAPAPGSAGPAPAAGAPGEAPCSPLSHGSLPPPPGQLSPYPGRC